MDTPTVQIPGFSYTAGTMDLGKSYAQGMEAGTQAGEALGQGITSAAGVMARNQNATDMLNAMKQAGILSDKAYQAVAGKSLGAKEQMLGLYANQWVAQQANELALARARGEAAIDVAKQHQLILDAWNQAKAGNPMVMDPKKMFYQPPQNQPQNPAVNLQSAGQPPNPAVGQGPSAAGPKPNVSGTPRVAGTRYVTDSDTGKTGWLYPSGQFVTD